LTIQPQRFSLARTDAQGASEAKSGGGAAN